MRLRCYPDSRSASAALYTDGWPDYPEMKFVAAYLRPGDGVVDVGANVGVYTLFALSRTGLTGHVHAFEAEAGAAARLRENVALNDAQGRVTVHPVAAGAEREILRFSKGREDTTSRLACTSGEQEPGTVELETERLDDVIGEEELAMGKMDIEGAEPMALEGAERMLAERNPPVWLVELNGCCQDFGWTEEQVADWLSARGYDLALYDPDRSQLRRAPTAWRERDNVLAIARNRWSFVEKRLKGDETV